MVCTHAMVGQLGDGVVQRRQVTFFGFKKIVIVSRTVFIKKKAHLCRIATRQCAVQLNNRDLLFRTGLPEQIAFFFQMS